MLVIVGNPVCVRYPRRSAPSLRCRPWRASALPRPSPRPTHRDRDAATTASAAATTAQRGLRLRNRQLADVGHRQRPVLRARHRGHYSGYIGMAGNWARTEGCKTGNFLAWSSANSAQANTNYTKYHGGIGTGVYWYMGGPGVDPHWNGTTSEAYQVGRGAGGGRARGHEEAHGHLPGGVGRHRDAGDPAGPRQRLEQRLLLALQRAGGKGAPSRRTSTGPSSTASPPTSPRTRRTRSASTPRPRSGPASSGPAPPRSIPNTYEWTYLPETSNLSAERLPAGACAANDVRAVLRRADLVEQVRGDVAVVGRRRHHQRLRLDFDQIDVNRLK